MSIRGTSIGGSVECTFKISPAGAPTFVGCLGSRGEVSRCTFRRGPLSSLELPTGLAASPDGHFLYATSGYGAILTLHRSAETGAMTPAGCISGDRDRGFCTLAAVVEARHGYHPTSPLTGIRRPLVSANGHRLFAPARTQDALVAFHRDPKTGTLSHRRRTRRCGSFDPEPGGQPRERAGATADAAWSSAVRLE